MARINVGADCTIRADFVLKNRSLSDAQSVIFRTLLATENGSVQLEHSMTPNDSSSVLDAHATLYCDLQGLRVLPGTYTWDLLLQEEDGTLHCLMPSADNILCIYSAAVSAGTEV